jgi:hypothetical protein
MVRASSSASQGTTVRLELGSVRLAVLAGTHRRQEKRTPSAKAMQTTVSTSHQAAIARDRSLACYRTTTAQAESWDVICQSLCWLIHG